MARLRRRLRSRFEGRAEKGVALVEFVLVLPVLAALMLGTIEAGFLWRDVNQTERATSAAARTVSTNTPFESSFADYEALRAIDAGMASVDNAVVTKVIIYRASNANGAVPNSCRNLATGGVNGLCNVYNATQLAATNLSGFPRGSLDNPQCISGSWDQSWCPITRDRDPVPDPDYVGVYVEAQYETFTGLFPATLTVTEQAVFQLEPEIPTS